MEHEPWTYETEEQIQSSRAARDQRAAVCRSVLVGGIVLTIALVTIALLLWGFRWPATIAFAS